MSKKIISIVIVIVMILSSISTVFALTDSATISTVQGITYKDLSGHWASEAIYKWSGYGVISGYGGFFRPDDSITRGEMACILNNIMGYQSASKNIFTDLEAGQFYTEPVLKANAAGIMTGDGAALVRPTDMITREEAAVMIAKAFAVKDGSLETTAFKDAGVVSSWARASVFGLEAKGYINGSNGKYNPKANITRAETVSIINNIVKGYYTKAGTYTDNVAGTVVIKVANVILKGITISENLIIAEGVGHGDATLESVTVKGNTVVRGGGENSIHITGTSSITNIKIEANGDKLRIVVSEGNFVKEMQIAKGEEIIITGAVGNVEIDASNATVYATAASITSATINGDNSTIILNKASKLGPVSVLNTAENTVIKTEKGAIVGLVTAEAKTTIIGDGAVEKVVLKEGANNSTISTPNTQTIVTEGVAGTTAAGGVAVTEGSKVTNNSAGDGIVIPTVLPPATPATPSNGGKSRDRDDSPSRVTVSSIGAISGTPQVGSVLTAGALTPAGATVSYQWRISTDGTTFADIPGATSSTYTPVIGDTGKYIKVTATGTGSYSGSVTSNATSAVAEPAVSSVSVRTAPTKTAYTEGETLDLAGLVVTLTKTDASTQDVAFANFAANGITTVKANGDALAASDTAVVISVNGKTASQAITVAPISLNDVTSPQFTISEMADNTVTVTLTGGTFKAGTISASDFTFTGSDSGVLAAAASFTRTSDTVVTITGFGALTGGTDNIVLVKGTTQASQAASAAAAASRQTTPAEYFTLTGSEITGYDIRGGVNVVIPGTIGVTGIGNRAFVNSSITTITIPNGITYIGDVAFGTTHLTSITIPDTVTSIGEYAFVNCTDLTSVTLPNDITVINYETFYNCSSLTSITLPDNVTSIGDYGFGNCSALASINLSNVTAIGETAFVNDSLTAITIADGASLAFGAFHGNDITSITIGSSATIGNGLLDLTSGAGGTATNFFRDAYTAGGAGTYTGTQTGAWTK